MEDKMLLEEVTMFFLTQYHLSQKIVIILAVLCFLGKKPFKLFTGQKGRVGICHLTSRDFKR